MASFSIVSVAGSDPDYIRYLLDPKEVYDCYYVVGNKKLAPVEKIGVVRKMLAAHSEVFRSQLLASRLKTQKRDKPEEIIDIFPDTFKNLLRFVYGFDTTDTMPFDDADSLLYAADKYLMTRLKNQLAIRLMSLLDYNNICSLLNNPACFTVLELNSAITKILQKETDKVLTSSQFLGCSPDAFVKILEQKYMNVSELEVWRAAVTWARTDVTQDDRDSVRKRLEKPLKYIRICTLPLVDFCKEVVPTGILTSDEVAAVCKTLGTEEKLQALPEVCDNTDVRKAIAINYEKSSKLLWVGKGGNGAESERSHGECFTLTTQESSVEITTLGCWSGLCSVVYNVTVKFEQVGRPEWVTSVTRKVIRNGAGGVFIEVSTKDRELLLKSNTRYNITVTSDNDLVVYNPTQDDVHSCEHFTVERLTHEDGNKAIVWYIRYKTLTPQ